VIAPSASYSFIVRLQIASRPGMLGRVASAIRAAGGDIGAVDLVETTRERTERDITVKARDSVHAQQIISSSRSPFEASASTSSCSSWPGPPVVALSRYP